MLTPSLSSLFFSACPDLFQSWLVYVHHLNQAGSFFFYRSPLSLAIVIQVAAVTNNCYCCLLLPVLVPLVIARCWVPLLSSLLFFLLSWINTISLWKQLKVFKVFHYIDKHLHILAFSVYSSSHFLDIAMQHPNRKMDNVLMEYRYCIALANMEFYKTKYVVLVPVNGILLIFSFFYFSLFCI